MHLSNYFEIINYQSISLAKVSFSRTQSMLYLYLCNRNNIENIKWAYFSFPYNHVPCSLHTITAKSSSKEGSRAARKAREGRRQAWRERQPPATFRGGWGQRRRQGGVRAAPVLLLLSLGLTSQHQGGGEKSRRGKWRTERG